MIPKALISALVLTISLSTNQALAAKPELIQEQLTKAREIASQMKPPVSFDALLDEADRLGVKCEGDLTRRILIATCKLKVDSVKLDADTARLREENAKLDEAYKAKRKELAKIVDETKQIVNEKLK
jgi:hypothetical protein